jgi:hypothetical protein
MGAALHGNIQETLWMPPVNIAAVLVAGHSAESLTTHGEAAFWRERGAEYAAKLFAGVDRHVGQEHPRFLVTDTPEAVPPGVTYVPTPFARGEAPGWWSKLAYFKPGLFSGKTLHLDLDNVVCGNLDALLALEPNPVIMMDDMAYPSMPNSSALLFYPDRMEYLYHEYVDNAVGIQRAFSKWPKASDQAFIADRVERKRLGSPFPFLFQSLLPAGYCLNSRMELELGCGWEHTSLVYGGWRPKPHEKHSVHAAPFYAEHWRTDSESPLRAPSLRRRCCAASPGRRHFCTKTTGHAGKHACHAIEWERV